MSKHPIVHIEFSAENLESAGQFYTDLFGWKITQMPDMGYAMFEGGLTRGTGGASPAMVLAKTDTDLTFLSLTDPEFDLSDRGVEGRAFDHDLASEMVSSLRALLDSYIDHRVRATDFRAETTLTKFSPAVKPCGTLSMNTIETPWSAAA